MPPLICTRLARMWLHGERGGNHPWYRGAHTAIEYHAEKGGSPQLPDAMDSCLPLGSMSISDH